jgi:hypothetical protein
VFDPTAPDEAVSIFLGKDRQIGGSLGDENLASLAGSWGNVDDEQVP